VKFLLDECAPRKIIGLLKKEGHSVQTLLELKRLGIQNGAVALLARDQNAIIITRDTDFLKLERILQQNSRIIVLKIHPPNPQVILTQLAQNLNHCIEYLNKPGKIVITNSECFCLKPEEDFEF
jgi:predicted nuclease of predicted toxin-antitoxin system